MKFAVDLLTAGRYLWRKLPPNRAIFTQRKLGFQNAGQQSLSFRRFSTSNRHFGSEKVAILFDLFKDNQGTVPVDVFLQDLQSTGFKKSDPRFKKMIDNLHSLSRELGETSIDRLTLNEEQFEKVIKDSVIIISQALQNSDIVIPDFPEFCKYVENFYFKCKANTSGKPAEYIPQLAKVNPEYWGVSLCTVDGQRFSIGDTKVPFTIQSTGKPINYAIALSELGSEVVHKYVGQEPSGRMFNELVLDQYNKPHNPMVNAGAIVICSLLINLIEPNLAVSEKFEWVCNYYKRMSGSEYLGFNNATFLSEKEAADRNYAIAYYLKEYKCFPKNAVLKDTMDFYFQLCSLEVNCETVSSIAATLANGGICPLTNNQVITSSSVRDVLSLMHSCGMYDFSGQFAFNVGLPTKSGVSGSLMVVIPNVMGICCWSPNLDMYGNSVRGVQFCEELVSVFNFHQYDNLRHSPHKTDPRKRKATAKASEMSSVLFAATNGDIKEIRRFYLSGMNMNRKDYDGRTVLHIAASEGHLNVVCFLVNVCKVDKTIKDRWNNTALDNALQFGHQDVVDFLSSN